MQLRLFTETLSLTPKQWVQGKALFLQEETLSRSSKQNLEGQKRGGEERAKGSVAHSSEAALW